MAVTSCRFINAEWDSALRETQATLEYKIRTDDYMAGPAILAGAEASTPHALPRLYTYLGSGAYVLSRRLTPQTDNSITNWRVTVNCGPLPEGTNLEDGDPGTVENPLARKVVFWLERISETVIVEEDRDGDPIANACIQPFEVLPQRERWLRVIVAQKNFATLEEIETIAKDYDDAVNDDLFRGEAIGDVLFAGIETTAPQYENGVQYYTATMRFIVKPGGWGVRYLNTGYMHFDEPGGINLVQAVDETGQPVTEPIKLAADGSKLAPGAAPTYVGPFNWHPEKSLAGLISDP